MKIIDKKSLEKKEKWKRKRMDTNMKEKNNVNISKHLLGLAEFPH